MGWIFFSAIKNILNYNSKKKIKIKNKLQQQYICYGILENI